MFNYLAVIKYLIKIKYFARNFSESSEKMYDELINLTMPLETENPKLFNLTLSPESEPYVPKKTVSTVEKNIMQNNRWDTEISFSCCNCSAENEFTSNEIGSTRWNSFEKCIVVLGKSIRKLILLHLLPLKKQFVF